MSLMPGVRLGPYEILSTIGSGGMGEVYRCRDTRVPRTVVALKTLLPTVAEDADFRKRFTREAQIIARLEHPHICALYDVGDEDGTAYIVMPMLEGRSLADRLADGTIPIVEALRIAVAVASALSYAHERGVLHRDVKPRNIMLGLDGSVKLVDFGVARTTRAAVDETTESATTLGGIVGTLEYMSPEQLAGRPIDARSDIFSLGVVVYEMIAGRHPFRGDTHTLTACAILDCKYPQISPGDPLLDAIDAVLSKAIAHDPAERFGTMAEFLKDLEVLQQASAPKAPEPSPAWNYRTPAAALAGIAAMAAVVVVFGSLINSMNREPSPSTRDTAAAEPSGLVNARPRGNETVATASNYRHVTAPLSGQVTGAVRELGVTVWRLRRSTDEDPVRLLVHEAGATAEQWTPERVELGTPLALGDRVRVSIESPRAGHLYVIDRERYADGSTGVAHVIFPTRHTSGGDNRLLAGRLIDIPAQTDRPPYFTLRRSRADQTAELLTVIVSDQPLMELTPAEHPLQITSAMLEQLEHRGSATLEQLEMVGGAGRAWSREEQDAAADRTRLLTQDAPAPQTVFRIVTNEPGFLVARVTLAHQTDSRTR